MKRVILTGILIFLVAVFVGYIISAASGHLPPFPSRLPFSKNAENEQQQKILVVLVDDKNSTQPVIESIWMIYIYPESQPEVVFLPIYSLRDQSAHPEVQATFKYGMLGKMSSEFWKSLKDSYDLNWDHYLIFDNVSASQMIELITGKKAPKTLSQPPNLKKPADYQTLVQKYFKTYCALVKSGKTDPFLIEGWVKITKDVSTDMDRDKMEKLWSSILGHPQDNPCNIVSNK